MDKKWKSLYNPLCNLTFALERSQNLINKIKNDDYYVQMMQAWFFATALSKQYDATISLLESKKLEPFVQNKIIQKARKSRRISSETKKYLLNLKK